MLAGLLLFANGIFKIVEIGDFDFGFWASVILSACAVFACYFADTVRSRCVVYPSAAALHSLAVVNLHVDGIAVQVCTCALSVGLCVFLLVKYRNAVPTEIVDRKRLSDPVFFEINKFNLFANMICVVGLGTVSFAFGENLILRISVSLAVCVVSLLLIYIKQSKWVEFGRKRNAWEYAFTAFWLAAVLANAVIMRRSGQALGYVALVIVVLMAGYFIFDRPYVIEKWRALSRQA